MNDAKEAFVKGGLISWAGLFLVEIVLFQVNGTLPISFVPTVLLFVVGGIAGVIVQSLVTLNADVASSSESQTAVEQGSVAPNSYEEGKRF